MTENAPTTDAPAADAAAPELPAYKTALLEDLRGEKAPEQRWDPKINNQKETGRFE